MSVLFRELETPIMFIGRERPDMRLIARETSSKPFVPKILNNGDFILLTLKMGDNLNFILKVVEDNGLGLAFINLVSVIQTRAESNTSLTLTTESAKYLGVNGDQIFQLSEGQQVLLHLPLERALFSFGILDYLTSKGSNYLLN